MLHVRLLYANWLSTLQRPLLCKVLHSCQKNVSHCVAVTNAELRCNRARGEQEQCGHNAIAAHIIRQGLDKEDWKLVVTGTAMMSMWLWHLVSTAITAA